MDVWNEVVLYYTKNSQMRKKIDVNNDKDGILKNKINHETKWFVAIQIQLSIVNYYFKVFNVKILM